MWYGCVFVPSMTRESLQHTHTKKDKCFLGLKYRFIPAAPQKRPELWPWLPKYIWRTVNSTVTALGQRGDAYVSGCVRQALADSTATQQCPGWKEVLWWRKWGEMEIVCVTEREREREKSDMPRLLRCHSRLRKAVSQHRVGGIH